MLDVHQRIHSIKKADPLADAVPRVASDLSGESRLLCFDEFQVTDIADAMILKRLFEHLFENGVVVVATSNRPPSGLYEGGLNRARFLPFIDTLHEHCDVVSMDSDHDYRRACGSGGGETPRSWSAPAPGGNDDESSSSSSSVTTTTTSPVLRSYHWPPDDPRTKEAVDTVFGGTKSSGSTEVLPVKMGRTITITTSRHHHHEDDNAENGGRCCGRFSFRELCEMPLGAPDYLAIADHCSTVIVEDVPLLDASRYNEARRFVTMIDAFYESSVLRRLVLSASVPVEELFVGFEATLESSDGDEELLLPSSSGGAAAAIEDELAVIGQGGSSSSVATTTIKARLPTGNNGENNNSVDVEWSATGRIGVSLAQLSSVKEVVFSFRRAESRLHELCRGNR